MVLFGGSKSISKISGKIYSVNLIIWGELVRSISNLKFDIFVGLSIGNCQIFNINLYFRKKSALLLEPQKITNNFSDFRVLNHE
jgi:hypothetical protein